MKTKLTLNIGDAVIRKVKAVFKKRNTLFTYKCF